MNSFIDYKLLLLTNEFKVKKTMCNKVTKYLSTYSADCDSATGAFGFVFADLAVFFFASLGGMDGRSAYFCIPLELKT